MVYMVAASLAFKKIVREPGYEVGDEQSACKDNGYGVRR